MTQYTHQANLEGTTCVHKINPTNIHNHSSFQAWWPNKPRSNWKRSAGLPLWTLVPYPSTGTTATNPLVKNGFPTQLTSLTPPTRPQLPTHWYKERTPYLAPIPYSSNLTTATNPLVQTTHSQPNPHMTIRHHFPNLIQIYVDNKHRKPKWPNIPIKLI